MTLISDPLIWPDTELVTVAYLTAGLTPVPVTARIPRPVPAKHVRVVRAGGATFRVFDQARLVAECRAANREDALDLATATRELLRRIPGTRSTFTVTSYEDRGFAYLPDPVDGIDRYLVTALVTFRAKRTS